MNIKHLFVKSWQWLKELNFFLNNSTDEYEIHSGRIATRIYLVLLISFLFVFMLYTGLENVTQTVNIAVPTVEKYRSVLSTHPNLICSCKNIDLLQGGFIKLTPRYHQVCSSDFMSPAWISFLRTLNSGSSTDFNNWQYMSLAQFQLLGALCELANTTVNDALDIFLQTKLLVPQVNKEADFLSQCQVLTSAFYSSIVNTFDRSLSLSNVLKQGDLLASGISSNYIYDGYYSGQGNDVSVSGYPNIFNNIDNVPCSCYLNSSCVVAVYATDARSNGNFLVPGCRSGCYVYDALMLSTLECYFNLTCLTTIRIAIQIPFNVQTLIATNSSLYTPNTLINTIVRQLFLEEWVTSYNFTAYYLACAPTACSYTIDDRRAFFVVLGTLVGVWGGLTRGLDLIVPRAVQFGRGQVQQWTQRATAKWRRGRVQAFQ